MRNKILLGLALTSMVGLMSACDDETEDTPPECTQATEATDCDAGEQCISGVCVANNDECVEDNDPLCQGFVCNDGQCVTECVGSVDCAEGYDCDIDTGECVSGPRYTKVLIVSETTGEPVHNKFNPGPDIDAVAIIDGPTYYASQAEGQAGAFDGDPSQATTVTDLTAALGEEDAIAECSPTKEDGTPLVFSLGAGEDGTPDGKTGIGFILLSDFQTTDGAETAPDFDLDGSGSIKVFELNKTDSSGNEICAELSDVVENYRVYLADDSVQKASLTNADGYLSLSQRDQLVSDGKLVDLGTHTSVAEILPPSN